MFQLLFERSADAIWLFDPQSGEYVDCNQAAVTLMRAQSKEQMLKARPADLSAAIQPDGRTSAVGVAEVTARIEQEGTQRFEWLGRRLDGQTVPLEVTSTPISANGRPLHVIIARDVTERKQAEQKILELNQSLERRIVERTAELTASQARLRTLLEHAPEAIVVFDGETGRFLSGNAHACRLYGLEASALPDLTPAEVSPEFQPDGRRSAEAAREKMAEALRGGAPVFDWMHRNSDGRLIPTEVRLVRLPAEGRSLLCATIIDNTERFRTEEMLRRRGAQIQRHRNVLLELAQSDKSDFQQALLQICSLAAATLDVARVGYWSLPANDSAIVCDLLYLRDPGRADATFKGARLGVSDCPAYFAALAQQRPIVAGNALTHPATRGLSDNYLRPLGITSMLDAPVWVRGEVVGVLCHEHIGAARNWSAEEIDFVSALAAMVSLALEESNRARSESLLRESEAKFRALFEASSQGVMLHDEEKFLEVNPACLRILGFSCADEIIGKHPAETSAPIQPDGERADVLARRHIQDCLAHGHTRFEWLARNPQGRDVPLEVILTRIQWGGRRIIQAVISDISERKQAEAELLKALAREKELNQLKSNFVSMVSHEFRTPLGIIQSSSEILNDYSGQLEPAERAEQLNSITKNTRRMAEMMEEILALSRLEAGRMEFRPEPLDLSSFCRRVVEEVLSATERRCVIELSLASLPDAAQADGRLLHHIFTNLLTNAVKYSEAGCKVWFSVERNGREAICRFRDKGIGIPDADQKWLFNAFQRGHNVGDRPGTGLGLVLVKRCVELHHGYVQINSKAGEGTTATVRLPVFESSSR